MTGRQSHIIETAGRLGYPIKLPPVAERASHCRSFRFVQGKGVGLPTSIDHSNAQGHSHQEGGKKQEEREHRVREVRASSWKGESVVEEQNRNKARYTAKKTISPFELPTYQRRFSQVPGKLQPWIIFGCLLVARFRERAQNFSLFLLFPSQSKPS